MIYVKMMTITWMILVRDNVDICEYQAIKLCLMLVEGGRSKRLVALYAFHTLLVVRPPVHDHHDHEIEGNLIINKTSLMAILIMMIVMAMMMMINRTNLSEAMTASAG